MGSIIRLMRRSGTQSLPTGPVRVLGIDLGTTNSVVATLSWDPKEPSRAEARCIEVDQNTREGKYTHVLVPSVVALYSGRVWVGEGARGLRADPSARMSQNRNIFFECKNDMGSKRTYHRAPEGFKSAPEIGAHVLRFLKEEATTDDPTPVARTVVTVPASFQIAQRGATIEAAKLAGIDLGPNDLLDEPVAAFIDYLNEHELDCLPPLSGPRNLLVFDYGGGTCDVAVFRIERRDTGAAEVAPLAVSRYHHLGGGDIDRAIAHDVLIPQIIEQNRLGKFELAYEDKKLLILPCLLGVAEALKVSMSREIGRLQAFGKYEQADKSSVATRQPYHVKIPLKDRTLSLTNPTLNAEQFEAVCRPFRDRDMLYARETEYYLTQSIFAPLQDGVDRSDLTPEEIDICLAVGGSSLLPWVVQDLGRYLPNARILTYPDVGSYKTCVARGAAYHALALALTNRPLIQPVCHTAIAINTQQGNYVLIEKGSQLPYPSEGLASAPLAAPRTVLHGTLPIRVEIVSNEAHGDRLLLGASWELSAPVGQGEPLDIHYRLDANQVLSIQLVRTNRRDEVLDESIDNPLTNVVNPSTARLWIEEKEEALRLGEIEREDAPQALSDIAVKYAELGLCERALDYLARAMRLLGHPDAAMLNNVGIYAGRIGDWEREEAAYREAARLSQWYGSLFNLALSQWNRGKHSDAVESIDKALAINRNGPSLVLRGMLAQASGDQSTYQRCLTEAFSMLSGRRIDSLDKWELGWFVTCCDKLGDSTTASLAREETRKRLRGSEPARGSEGVLPPEGDLPVVDNRLPVRIP